MPACEVSTDSVEVLVTRSCTMLDNYGANCRWCIYTIDFIGVCDNCGPVVYVYVCTCSMDSSPVHWPCVIVSNLQTPLLGAGSSFHWCAAVHFLSSLQFSSFTNLDSIGNTRASLVRDRAITVSKSNDDGLAV